MRRNLICCVSLPLLYGIGVVINAIFSNDFSSSCAVTEDLSISFYNFAIDMKPLLYSSSLFFQIQLELTMRYFFHEIFLRDFNIVYMIKDGLLKYKESLLYIFWMQYTKKILLLISKTANHLKSKIQNSAQTSISIDDNCRDEFVHCWRLKARNNLSTAEYFEILLLFLSLAAFFVLCYGKIDQVVDFF